MITNAELIKTEILIVYKCPEKNIIINIEAKVSDLECNLKSGFFPMNCNELVYSVLIRECELCGGAHRVYL